MSDRGCEEGVMKLTREIESVRSLFFFISATSGALSRPSTVPSNVTELSLSLFEFLHSLYGFTPLYTWPPKLPVYSDYSSDWEST